MINKLTKPVLRLVKKSHDGFVFRSAQILSGDQCTALLALVQRCGSQTHGAENKLLGGRALTASGTIDGLGESFIKSYVRGGFFGHFVKDAHLRVGPPRSELEYSMLSFVRSVGVTAPTPLVCICTGTAWYRTWLVLEEIKDARTFVTIALEEPDLLDSITEEVARQIKLLIAHGVQHVDFHPGNVIVDRSGRVVLIDFDKAKFTKQNRTILRDLYVRRWRRAVLKHKLPHLLSELMALKLRTLSDVVTS